jgi:negative regulator of sigma E activity
MTNGSSNSNHHPLHPRDDRETLSALFDGELSGDAVRFAFKRLDHDPEWRDSCGRWQMIGDALRGEATLAAPSGFAAGVMQLLTTQVQTEMAVAPALARTAEVQSFARSRRRWMGGAALAASVAVAAVLVVRPFSESSPSGDRLAGMTTQAIPQPTSSEPQQTRTAANATASAPATAEQVVSLASADMSRSTINRRPNRASRTAVRQDRGVSASTQSRINEPATVVAAVAPGTAHQPFHPPADEIVTRPWPRAVLSDNAASGALTVGLGTSSTSPSFYPFEPRLPSDSEPTRSQATEPQR